MFWRVEQNSLQAFHKRFCGPVRALPPEPAGADAWRATTYGHVVLQTNPLGSALDEEVLVLLHYAGEVGFTRKELGQYCLKSRPTVAAALQILTAPDCREVLQLTGGSYR